MNCYSMFKKAAMVLMISGGLLLSGNSVSAQPDPCTGPDADCPIDGGLSLLIAAGIGLGAKKAYDRKKANLKNAE